MAWNAKQPLALAPDPSPAKSGRDLATPRKWVSPGVLENCAVDVASGLVGAVIKDPVQDRVVWQEYLETVVKEREGRKDFYRACKKAEG